MLSNIYLFRKDAKGKKDQKHQNATNTQPDPAQQEAKKKDKAAIGSLEGLPKRDRQRIEKLLAEVEYEEAHGNNDAADKLRQRIKDVKAAAKAKAEHKAERMAEVEAAGHETTKVIHSGGRKNKVGVQA